MKKELRQKALVFLTKILEYMINLFEKKLIKVFSIIFLLSITANLFFDIKVLQDIANYMDVIISGNLDIFINLSSIFIGLYFTVLTLFLSYSAIGVIKDLDYNNIKKMINYILIGFIFSFLLLSLALFLPYKNGIILIIYSFVLLVLLLNTIRFGLILFLWVRKFIKDYESNKVKIIEQENYDKLLKQRLEFFLDGEDKKNL